MQDHEIETKIHLALGEAASCWEPLQEGILNGDHVSAIADRLMKDVIRFAEEYRSMDARDVVPVHVMNDEESLVPPEPGAVSGTEAPDPPEHETPSMQPHEGLSGEPEDPSAFVMIGSGETLTVQREEVSEDATTEPAEPEGEAKPAPDAWTQPFTA